MRFFLDNCLPPRWAPALAALSQTDGHDVTHLRAMFRQDVTDVHWLQTLGGEGDWIVISGDPRITRNRHEREAWRQSGLTAFFLHKSWSNFTLWDKTWRFVRWWPSIIQQASLVMPGAGFIIPVNFGKLQQIPLS